MILFETVGEGMISVAISGGAFQGLPGLICIKNHSKYYLSVDILLKLNSASPPPQKKKHIYIYIFINDMFMIILV